jgi:N-acetylglucosamine-6-phosphate deacetylase
MAQQIGPIAVFDGSVLHPRALVTIDKAAIVALTPVPGREPGLPGLLVPGLIDLQVNGGGGRMVDGGVGVDDLAEICAVHGRLGATGILPTLITDTPDATSAVIAAGIAATAAKVPGFLGLHLEGPHLDRRRKGAHDPSLIRPMQEDDLDRLCAAVGKLPALMVTLAPEAASPEQIARLAAAGAIVSLGHSDCSMASAKAAIRAGASCATHLFNAMSQLGSREPGLVGAVLDGQIAAGMIADGIHVAPATMRIAVAARPKGLFLVSDAMALAGTDLAEFTLGGRRILRRDGRLTLEDGTLAGADLGLPQAVRVMTEEVGLAVDAALAMATSVPAAVIRAGGRVGSILPGRSADLVHLDEEWRVAQVWRDGVSLSSP